MSDIDEEQEKKAWRLTRRQERQVRIQQHRRVLTGWALGKVALSLDTLKSVVLELDDLLREQGD